MLVFLTPQRSSGQLLIVLNSKASEDERDKRLPTQKPADGERNGEHHRQEEHYSTPRREKRKEKKFLELCPPSIGSIGKRLKMPKKNRNRHSPQDVQ